MFERAGLRLEGCADRPIASARAPPKLRPTMRARTAVGNPSAGVFTAHSRAKIRKMKPRAGNGNGDRVGGVQTEKPDARLATCGHVGAHVQLRKSRESGHVGREPQPHAGHAKRDDGDPRAAVERIDLQGAWNQRTQQRRRRSASARTANRATPAPSPTAREAAATVDASVRSNSFGIRVNMYPG